MQNIFWCHSKIYGTDLCCNLFFLRFILHLVNSDAKIDIYFFHYAKVFYEIDLSSLSAYYCSISIIRFNLLSLKIWSTQTDAQSTSDLLYQYYRYQTICRSFTLQLQTNFHTWIFLLFFTNLHILVCKRKIARLRSSVSLESFVSNSNYSENRY